MSHKTDIDITKAKIVTAMDQVPDNCLFISVHDDGKTQLLYAGKSAHTLLSIATIAQKYMLDDNLGVKFPDPPKTLKAVT